MYLNQMGAFAKKIKRSINPTKRETCEQRVPQAIQMIEEVTVLKTQWSKAKSDDAKDKAKWFYYDQSPFQQWGYKKRSCFGSKGVENI